MRRYKWRKLPFLAVFEATKLGWPHLHILLRSGFIEQRWLSEQMADLIQSPIVDIRLARSPQQIASYCAKYVGKDTGKFGTSKRYWQSQDYDLRPKHVREKDPLPGFGWERETISLHQWCNNMRTGGWSVERVSQCRAIARAPP